MNALWSCKLITYFKELCKDAKKVLKCILKKNEKKNEIQPTYICRRRRKSNCTLVALFQQNVKNFRFRKN